MEVFESPPQTFKDEKEEDEENKKICLLRGMLRQQLQQDLASKDDELDELTVRRFLRARELHVEKALAMILKYLKWKQGLGSISASQVANQVGQNKMFAQGKDKKGRPIAVVFGASHFASKGDEFKRFLVFALDKLCSRMGDGQEKFTIIGDLKGYRYCNSDVRGYMTALSILQDYYPERLGKVLVINAPYIFMTLWKIIYPLIDNNTRTKIAFVDKNSALLQDIDEAQLPDMYGGKLKLVPIQDY